jgi:hypothetical protein
LIGATALAHDLTIVTRNTKDFEGVGAATINPGNLRISNRSATKRPAAAEPSLQMHIELKKAQCDEGSPVPGRVL